MTLIATDGCGNAQPSSAPTAPAPTSPTADLTTLRAVRPESAVSLIPFAHDALITLPPGRPGRYGGEDAAGWGRFASTKLGPLVRGGDGTSRVAAAVAIRDDLVLYARADRDHDAGVFVFRSRRDELISVADAREMRSQLAAGASLDLAEPQMLVAGDTIWLILRIADQINLLRIDARQVAGGAPRLSRPFAQLTDGQSGDASAPFTVLRDDAWFVDTDGSLAVLRPTTGECWRVGTGGKLISQPNRTPRPVPTVGPLVLPARVGAAEGASPPDTGPRVLEFFTDAPPLSVDPLAVSAEPLQYPLLVVHGPNGDTVIDRDAMNMRLGFPKRALRITAWCVDGNGVLAYDAMSGEIFRITLTIPAKG
ncbi:MAG: hypothetical protein JWM57_2742 [Phycisphaerales bacterium]|nr:hypothetical protein [Phycisphaerales bacterium]